MMPLLRNVMRVPRVSLLRGQKLRLTKNRRASDRSASISISISNDSSSDNTSHLSEQEMNLSDEDEEMDSIEWESSKKISFHPDMITAVMYFNDLKPANRSLIIRAERSDVLDNERQRI
eukprot:scaffold11161_cov52-Attheya_sp.AAC.1